MLIRRILAGIALLGLFVSPGLADSAIPPSWQSLVADAGFIGIVRCEAAGGIVAKYKVLDSWKGPTAGAHLIISQQVNTWEPQYPLALVGERYLMVAQNYRGEWSLPSAVDLSSATPLWWRRVHPDYFCAWPPVKLPAPEHPTGLLQLARGGRGTTVDSFRIDVGRFLDRDERHIELEALRAEVIWNETRYGAVPCTTQTCRNVGADSLELVVESLIHTRRPHTNWVAIYQAGREECLRQLEVLPKSQADWTPELLEMTKKQIRCRLGLEISTPESDRFVSLPYDSTTRQQLASILQDPGAGHGPRTPAFREAFQRLTERDPELVADFLSGWSPSTRAWSDSGTAYVLGSYFAHKCGRDRTHWLRQLLSARDPYVRVAGAVYLCFEDAHEGVRELKRLTSLPGDAGAWAALALARHGDKNGMARALEVLADPGAGQMAGVPHRNLQKRTIELLSNSAALSGLNLPTVPGPDSDTGLATYVVIRRWWEENQHRVRLHDPWLHQLAAQKID
jgi:hypothetical protein